MTANSVAATQNTIMKPSNNGVPQKRAKFVFLADDEQSGQNLAFSSCRCGTRLSNEVRLVDPSERNIGTQEPFVPMGETIQEIGDYVFLHPVVTS